MLFKRERAQAAIGGAIAGGSMGFLFSELSLSHAFIGLLIGAALGFIMELLASKGIYTRFTIDSREFYEEAQEQLEKEFYDAMREGLTKEGEEPDTFDVSIKEKPISTEQE